MKLLITAFDPFGGETTNPALEAVKRLPDAIGSIRITKIELPTSFSRSGKVLADALYQNRPDVVLCTGQAGGRCDITIERVALNICDASVPDNDGYIPSDTPIFPDGPAAYFATIPLRKMVNDIRSAGIPCSVSNSAGTFVCNHVMYTLLHLQKTMYPEMTGGFIHVPFTPSQSVCHPGSPSMSLETIVQGLTEAIKAIKP